MKDQAGHDYVDIENIRLTYVPACDRSSDNNWAGGDVIRIQSYRNDESMSLHRGAELPISGPQTLVQLILGLCVLANIGNGRGA
jgi:hypothetical protein